MIRSARGYASLAAGLIAVAAPAQLPEILPSGRFSYTLDHDAALTSAGIYDQAGHLVRVLWTMEPRPAGSSKARWDGKTGDGEPAPDARYTFKVAVNASTYRNIGVIGNTATPPTTFGHVPNNFECVAVDTQGVAYTVHDWDEPHHDVIRWDPTTGKVLSHSGHPVGELLKAVAVDGSYAYVVSHASAGDRTKARFAISRLQIDSTPGSTRWPRVPFTKAGRQIEVYNGTATYPDGVSSNDLPLMYIPLLSLAVAGHELLVTDSLAGQVRRYDKETGEALPAWPITLPHALAIAPDGRVWVGHQHGQVSILGSDGTVQATPLSDLGHVQALAFAPDGRLFVADSRAGTIRIYTVQGSQVSPSGTLGRKAEPGDRAADRFYTLHGLAVDRDANVFCAQNEFFFNGGRLAKFSPDGRLLWEQRGLEFQSNGVPDDGDPDTFYSFMHHVYRLDRAAGTAAYLGNSYAGEGFHGDLGASIRVTRLGGKPFCVTSTGDGVQVYRVDAPQEPGRSPVLHLVSVLGRAKPLPTGKYAKEPWKPENAYLWSWHDDKGDGRVDADEVEYFTRPEAKRPIWQYGAITLDASNDLWLVSSDRGGNTIERMSVWRIPLRELDTRGNPVYGWKDARPVITNVAALWRTQPKLARHAAEDGLTYLLGYTPRKDAPQNGAVWMAGNTLACYAGTDRRWQIVLPGVAVGLDLAPGGPGGCFVGGGPFRGELHHYTRDGLRIGVFGPDPAVMGTKPDNPSGLLDFHGAIQVRRDPRDGLLDVFVEDDFNLRIAWYRVDDSKLRIIEGPVESP